MSDRVERASSWVVVPATGLWVVYLLGGVTAGVLKHRLHSAIADPLLVPFTMFSTVGWLLAARRPRNPLGWLFLTIGALAGMGAWTEAYVNLAVKEHWASHGVAMFAAWVQLWFWYPLLFIATAFTPLLFPDGLPSRRWRPLLWLLVLGVGTITVMAALSPQVQFGKRYEPNPIGLGIDAKDVESTTLFKVGAFIAVGCMLAALASLAIRVWRSRGIQRAQLKWFLLGVSLVLVDVLIGVALPNTALRNDVDNYFFPIAIAVLPLSCGLAILRYRLYDIDRIVSRTVAYVVVTATVVGFYIGAIVLSDRVLGVSSSFAVAASTLAAAAAFQPLRRRVQRLVDRRFDRAAYDARRTVDAFSARLRDEVDVDAIRGEFLDTVTSAVAPASASVWVLP
jgi:hypothetical protein